MYKKYKKLLIISSLLVLVSSIFLFKIGLFGDENKVIAQTIICEETSIVNDQEINALEIPIGKAIDQAEYLAEEIAAHAREIIRTIPLQVQAVNDLSFLVQQCGAVTDSGTPIYCSPDCHEVEVCGKCVGRGCETEWDEKCDGFCGLIFNEVCCCQKDSFCSASCGTRADCKINESNNPSACSGDPEKNNCDGYSQCCCTTDTECQAFACQNTGGADRACPPGIPNQSSIVRGHTSTIVHHQGVILSLFEEFGELSDTDRDLVMPKLEESRRKLFDCVVTPGEAAAVLRGDTSGKWLVTCDALLSYFIPVHSYLPFKDTSGNIITPEQLEQDCYGNTYCDALKKQDEIPPYDDPCANDYYCCFISH